MDKRSRDRLEMMWAAIKDGNPVESRHKATIQYHQKPTRGSKHYQWPAEMTFEAKRHYAQFCSKVLEEHLGWKRNDIPKWFGSRFFGQLGQTLARLDGPALNGFLRIMSNGFPAQDICRLYRNTSKGLFVKELPINGGHGTRNHTTGFVDGIIGIVRVDKRLQAVDEVFALWATDLTDAFIRVIEAQMFLVEVIRRYRRRESVLGKVEVDIDMKMRIDGGKKKPLRKLDV
jgi:hypothetical protein